MSPCPDCDGPGRAELERSAKELAAAGCVLAADLEEWLVVLAGRAPADSRESLKGWWDAFTRFAPVTPAVTLEWVDGPFVAGPRREESSETPRTTSAGAKPPSSNPCDCNPYHSAVCATRSLSPHGRDEAERPSDYPIGRGLPQLEVYRRGIAEGKRQKRWTVGNPSDAYRHFDEIEVVPAAAFDAVVAERDALEAELDGAPCACRFDDDDKPTGECFYHKAIRAERDRAIQRADDNVAKFEAEREDERERLSARAYENGWCPTCGRTVGES